jgi:hypothetical protein
MFSVLLQGSPFSTDNWHPTLKGHRFTHWIVRTWRNGAWVNIVERLDDPVNLYSYQTEPVIRANTAYEVLIGYEDQWGEVAWSDPTPFSVDIPLGCIVAPAKVRHLDRVVSAEHDSVTAVYEDGFTTWTLPYSVALNGSQGTLVAFSGGSIIASARPAADKVRVEGDLRDTGVQFGILYESVAVLSTLYLRDERGMPEFGGRLILRYLDIHYHATTDLKVTIVPEGRAPMTYGAHAPMPGAGTLHLPVQARNSDAKIILRSEGAGAFGVVGLDWEGFYHSRSKRQ